MARLRILLIVGIGGGVNLCHGDPPDASVVKSSCKSAIQRGAK